MTVLILEFTGKKRELNFILSEACDKRNYQIMHSEPGLPRWLGGGDMTASASAGDVRDLGSSPGSERSPGGGHGNPLQYSCLENSMDRRAWQGYSPWGHNELDRTERISTHARSV